MSRPVLSEVRGLPADRGALAGSAAPVVAAALLLPEVLAAAATLTLVVTLPLDGSADTLLSRLTVAAFVLGMTALTVVGAILIRRRPGHPMGWWMTVTGVSAVLSRLVAGSAGALVGDSAGGPAMLLWATNWAWIPAQVAALEMLLRFPDGLLPGRRWRGVEVVLLGWGALLCLVTMLLPGELGQTNLAHLHNPWGVGALGPVLEAALGPLFLGVPLLSVVCASALVVRWRRGDEEGRQQLRWIAAAAALIAIAAPFAMLGDLPNLVLALAFVLLPAAICTAVLRTRLWELGLVVRRTVVYGLAVGVLAAGYVAAVGLFDATATPWLAGLTIAVLAVPVRDLAGRLLERWLFGDRGDPGLVARRLASRLAGSETPLLEAVAGQLRQSLRLPYVAVTGPDGSPHTESGVRNPVHASVRLPLVVTGRHVGWLVAQERAPGEGLGSRDRALLEQVAQQAGLAAHARQLDADLRDSHERLLTVREHERQRLRRDLHDGIGPTLGAIGMLAEAARNLVAADAPPHQVGAVLGRIESSTETAVGEVRRVIDDLLPGSLERSGLRTALLEAAEDQLSGVSARLSIPESLPPLGAQVELATYRIAVEAMRNVRRHARASSCLVRLEVDADAVHLEVSDDGIGLGGAPAGVGRQSMASRAEQAGGTVHVCSDPGRHGTRLVARLPRRRP
jgi:signal transduction histidine kinase